MSGRAYYEPAARMGGQFAGQDAGMQVGPVLAQAPEGRALGCARRPAADVSIRNISMDVAGPLERLVEQIQRLHIVLDDAPHEVDIGGQHFSLNIRRRQLTKCQAALFVIGANDYESESFAHGELLRLQAQSGLRD